MNRDQPEPCTSGPCRSPLACGSFGYCRQRNEHGTPDAASALAAEWRAIAKRRKAEATTKESTH